MWTAPPSGAGRHVSGDISHPIGWNAPSRNTFRQASTTCASYREPRPLSPVTFSVSPEMTKLWRMFAPMHTPPAVIEQLNAEINRTLNLPDIKQQLFGSGAEAVPGTPAELADFIKLDMATTRKVMRHTVR